MTDDLVKQLRFWNGGHKSDEKMAKAADRIEQLEAALRSIAANSCCDNCREAALVARAALGEKKDER